MHAFILNEETFSPVRYIYRCTHMSTLHKDCILNSCACVISLIFSPFLSFVSIVSLHEFFGQTLDPEVRHALDKTLHMLVYPFQNFHFGFILVQTLDPAANSGPLVYFV